MYFLFVTKVENDMQKLVSMTNGRKISKVRRHMKRYIHGFNGLQGLKKRK